MAPHHDHDGEGGWGDGGGGDARVEGLLTKLPDFAPEEFAARGTLWYLARTLAFMLKRKNGTAKTVIAKAVEEGADTRPPLTST
jgi:hypothetical protein